CTGSQRNRRTRRRAGPSAGDRRTRAPASAAARPARSSGPPAAPSAGLGVDDAVWDVTVFTKNRDRLLDGEIAAKFLRAVLDQPKVEALLSDEHFSVDGTLIQAWASMKSFRPKDGSGEPPAPGRNGERNFHGEKPSNETHASVSDPEARLYRKGR